MLIAAAVAFIGLAGQAQAQPLVSAKPSRLREGDHQTRNITLEASVNAGARLSVRVSYSSDPSAVNTSFISKFTVQDNATGDRNPQDGKISLLLPKAFDNTGVYIIEVDEPRSVLRVVHEPNNTSYFRQFVDWLVGAAGTGRRAGSEPQSALERIENITRDKNQDKLAIWITRMPAIGQEIARDSMRPRIRSAVTPAWSRSGNSLAVSAWRNGKWVIASYTINRAGSASQIWQWNSSAPRVGDFSPVWSPKGDGVVFVRLGQDRKSDIWILELDRNRRPKKETRVTQIGNVQAVLGWDKDLGILFETKSQIEDHSSFRQIWAFKPTVPTVQITPLSDEYNVVRGGAPLRGTIIYAEENEGPPMSVLYEMNSTGKPWPLLLEESCSHRWPTVSHDEKWLAFESDCPPT